MKKIFTLIISIATFSLITAQNCNNEPIVLSSVKDTSDGTDITHARIYYNQNGLPVKRINYVAETPNFQNIKFVEKYYYTGNRLDSIIAFENETYTTKYNVYRRFSYDGNGQLTTVVSKREGVAEDMTSFSYTNGKVSAVSSPEYTITGVTFNTNGNLNTAKVELGGFTVTGTFTSDAKNNPFSGKLGLSDDYLSYFNKNNVLKFGAGTTDAITFTYSYNSNNYPSTSKRKEFVIASGTLNSEFSYGCLSDVVLSNSDKTYDLASNISPNPSKDGIFNINEQFTTWKVKNSNGQEILNSNTSRIDLSNHPNGMYFLEIETGSLIKTTKLIKY